MTRRQRTVRLSAWLLLACVLYTLALVLVATAAHASTSSCRTATGKAWCAHVTVVGHRAEGGPNENTLAALKHDRDAGAAFETDQWNLATGQAVIFHGYGPGGLHLGTQVDPASMPAGVTPDSTPGQLTLGQWRQLRTYGGQPLPTLRSWIIHAARWHVPGMIEIKYTPVDPADIAQLVRESGAKVTFYGQPHPWRGQCLRTGTDAMKTAGMTVGLKDSTACPTTLDQAADYGYTYVITSPAVITPDYVHQAHTLGLKVGEYDSKSRTVWAQLVEAKADYILAPHVRPLQRWLGERP